MADELDMPEEERQELIVEFLGESEGHLETLNAKLLEAETAVKEFTDMSDDDLDAMFRAAHTIKGTASFIGLTKVVDLTHELETILQRVKKKEMPLTGEIIDVLFMGLDVLQALVDDLKESGQEKTDITESVAKVKAVLEEGSVSVKKEVKQEEEPKKKGVVEAYLEAFIIDAEQNAESFSEDLVTLEKELENEELINELFRMMHTIKGSAGIINAVEIQDVAHSMESILSIVRDRKKAFPNMFSVLFQGIDTINGLINSLKKTKAINYDVKPLINSLDHYLEEIKNDADVTENLEDEGIQENLLEGIDKKEAEKKLLQKAIDEDKDVFKLVVIIESSVEMKKAKATLIERRLKEKGIIILAKPAFDTIDDNSQLIKINILFSSVVTEDDIRSVLSLEGVDVTFVEWVEIQKIKNALGSLEIEEGVQKMEVKEGLKMNVQKEPEKKISLPIESKPKQESKAASNKETSKSAPIQISTIRIDTKKLDSLMNLSGELVTIRAQFERLVSLFNEEIFIQRESSRLIDGIKSSYDDLTKDMQGVLDRVVEDKKESKKIQKTLNNLTEGLGSLEDQISKSALLTQIHALDETTSDLGKIASDIQTGVMQTRMIPIEGVFTRFKRIVRDISKSINKQVDLVIEGEDTELDKKLVDSLGDPLTHMIRNACDHGIESPEDREEVGKSEKGTVTLKAAHRGNNICIEVGDDGKGLDPEALVQSAIKKELVTEDQAAQFTEREKLNVLFLPGFSTAAKLTGLSGRGVGMDVVKNMITAVNGEVDIETSLGKGTTFILKIPLTLAIIQALLVVIGEEVYAIPLEAVTEIIKVSKEEIYSIDGNDTVKLRDHVLSLVELEKVIGLKGHSRSDQKFKRVVVISDGDSHLGVEVDSLIGESEIVIKSLSNHFASVSGISGATILGDGQIALILDPSSVMREARSEII